jgi:tetratricopeptide (TPR) repeat protein
MKCPECQFENREGAKFYKKCGANLDLKWPACGHPYDSENQFCDECGYDLIKLAPSAPEPTSTMLGRYDEAKAYYLKAIEIGEDMRFHPELALSWFQLAELLFEHYPGEKEEAIQHLNFAIDEFKAMKMQPSLEKVQALKNGY